MSGTPLRLIWQLDPFSDDIWERDWLAWLLSDFEVEHVVDLQNDVVAERALVVTAGETLRGISTDAYLARFGAAGHKVGVIHVSDESAGVPIDFYRHAAFVFRNYVRADALRQPHCRLFPLGYKSGFARDLARRDIETRRHRWSFAGQLKSSRSRMLEIASTIPGGYTHLTQRFADPNALSVKRYADMLNDTVFALCPRGFTSVDCFRVYEALEAGAIPVVEDDDGIDFWLELANPFYARAVRPWRARFWRANRGRALQRSYWKTAYGRDFPCPRVQRWTQLPALLDSIDVAVTSKRVRDWWDETKRATAAAMGAAVRRELGGG